MRRTLILLAITALALLIALPGEAGPKGKPGTCNTIQSGAVLNSVGDTVLIGYDEWGYNYQARMFNGKYCDAYRDAAWCQAYKDDNLQMKWNDAWVSNKDCDGDPGHLLDRHFGHASYIGSGAWLTNHMSGEYDDGSGSMCHWTYFVKIVAAPSDAVSVAGVWQTAGGAEIGPAIWGEFAILQEIVNDGCAGQQGVAYLSPYSAGFGRYGPKQ